MLVIWIPLSGGVLFGVERLHFESRCGGSDGDLREFQMFYMFSHADDQNAGNGKKRITIQAKDLYIADDVLYSVLD